MAFDLMKSHGFLALLTTTLFLNHCLHDLDLKFSQMHTLYKIFCGKYWAIQIHTE